MKERVFLSNNQDGIIENYWMMHFLNVTDVLTNMVNCSGSTFNLTLFWRVVRDLRALLLIFRFQGGITGGCRGFPTGEHRWRLTPCQAATPAGTAPQCPAGDGMQSISIMTYYITPRCRFLSFDWMIQGHMIWNRYTIQWLLNSIVQRYTCI